MIKIQSVREMLGVKMAGPRVLEKKAFEEERSRVLTEGGADLRLLSALLESIPGTLTPSERDRFALQLMDATRSNSPEKVRETVLNWAETARVREHPSIVRQIADYRARYAAGEFDEEGTAAKATS